MLGLANIWIFKNLSFLNILFLKGLHFVKIFSIFASLLNRPKTKHMTTLLKALQTNDSLTENGCVTNSTSLNNCVDLFFQIGAMRGQDKSRLLTAFAKAFGENPLTALKLIFWARDVRGGAGERQIFRDIASYLAEKRPSVMAKNLSLVTEFGRWDDLLVFIGTTLEKQALDLIAKGLSEKNKASEILSKIDTLSEDECAKILVSFE